MTGLKSWIVAQPMAYRHVDPVTPQVDQLARGFDAQLDLRMRFGEPPQPRGQPGSGEGGHGADRHGLARGGGFQAVQAALDLVEGAQQVRVSPHAGLGQADAVAGACEQGRADPLLQQPNLLADGARRHPHGLGGGLQAALAPCLDKGAQSQ
ncbi:hypothetical protein D3C85_1443910 [compost metagenome]